MGEGWKVIAYFSVFSNLMDNSFSILGNKINLIFNNNKFVNLFIIVRKTCTTQPKKKQKEQVGSENFKMMIKMLK